MKSVNPATESLIREYSEHDEREIEHRLRLAAAAFDGWRETSIADRAAILVRVADLLLERKDRYARLMTEEMGKPITAAESEIEKCAWVCEFYAEHAERMLSEQRVLTDASRSYIRFDPLGAVLAVMPWNFPYWQVLRFAAPSLMAGNVGLLKHAGNVCGVSLAIEELFRDAGAPEGVFVSLLLSSSKIESVISHPVIRAVTLTGSDRAGAAVGEQAGREIKKTVLELGGSDPFIVLGDADVKQAAEQAAQARLTNSGQSCIAAKRFIVEKSIADEFEQAFVNNMENARVGDPMDRETEVGPMAREDLLDTLGEQVQETVSAGAVVLTGGKRIDRKGFFYQPTVLQEVKPGMTAFDDETFGPVAAVLRAKDADEAIGLANLSQFGLGAALWSEDIERAERLAARIESGSVFINSVVHSDPRLPFGGVKRSGYGRELGEHGILEFVNIKTVFVG